ncbi:hypothetical protein ABER99_20395 [Paenibacillus glucanolyticus]|jgi:hypothetical protein|uniref:Uncharacterized protein n=1 Tax=Paenibacillus glucanolyticus TaxID=59843 RepID=A0A163GI97_9BACL|nr:hypothetical protein [Paenibacillus glucanolyticus]KZS44987.1 hypothetical protein AWU65_03125 [Paenibacillus glucanolyticus]OMF64800.1 hypothetical protein BK142_31385 [Paenibacillus glucanolyticus]
MKALILGNRLGIVESKATYPVKITSLFLNQLFDMNLNFSSRMKFSFRDGGTLRLKDHLTHADLQLAFILFRCCNAYGYIDLTNRKALYRRLENEFESPISEGQFYAALEKFSHHQLILSEESADGDIRHRLNYFMNEKTNKIGHYVLFHPFVFTKVFHELTLAEKKLIISAYAQASGSSKKIITRNLKQVDKTFRHAQFSGLLSFLHKSQKSHISDILNNLAQLLLPVETKTNAKLLDSVQLVKGKNGYKAELKFNSEFLIPVVNKDQQKYYNPLDACSLYPKFFSFLKREADFYGIGELFSDQHLSNRLVKRLRPVSVRLIRHAFHDLMEYVKEKGILPRNPEYMIKHSIEDKFNTILDKVITKVGADEFVRYPETREELVKERKWSFSQAALKSKLGIKKIRIRMEQTIKSLNRSYPVLPWDVSDYGAGPTTYQYQELRKFLDIDSIKREALIEKVDPFYYGDLEYNALLAIRNTNPKVVEDWIRGELPKLPRLPGKRLLPYNFRLENLVFSN